MGRLRVPSIRGRRGESPDLPQSASRVQTGHVG